MAQRAPAAKSSRSGLAVPREPANANSQSRAKALTALFTRAAKGAVADHRAAGRPVWGKVNGRLVEVRPGKTK